MITGILKGWMKANTINGLLKVLTKKTLVQQYCCIFTTNILQYDTGNQSNNAF
jgi:hypothetical protein